MKLKLVHIIYVVAAFVMVACTNTIIKTEKKLNNTWIYPKKQAFDINISEQNKPVNVFVNIENTENYKYSNLFLEITIISPDKKKITDTVDIVLADYKGKWFGTKAKNNSFYGRYLYKKGVLFPNKGTYKFEIKHIMRDDTLKGITKIGISIDKIN